MTHSTELALPLFYRQPEALAAATHGDVRLIDGDQAFAADTNAVALAAVEFAAAMRHYPIVFGQDDGFPLAVLGLGQGNRFLAAGRWADGTYLPAYVRRYPFVFAEASADGFLLALDMASERVVRGRVGTTDGAALFEDGKPSALTEGALAFCRDFHGAHIETLAFVSALKEQDLLVSQQADATLASGTAMNLGGFQVIDRDRFAALPDAVVLAWHRSGWLALIHFHFASLDRFAALLDRESSVELPADAQLSSSPVTAS